MGNKDIPPFPEAAVKRPGMKGIEKSVESRAGKISEICVSFPESVLKSIKSGDFGFMAQGIYNRNGNRVRSELLARLFIDRKLISPDVFIPIIEGSGYKTQFDFRVIEKSFETIWRKGLDGCFSVNINPSTLLAGKKFFSELQKFSTLYRIDPKRITIEILERETVSDFQSLNECILKLRYLGYSVAVDDYHPIGNNNAFTVHSLQGLNMVKFDGAYVADIFKRNRADAPRLRKELSKELDSIFLSHPGSDIVLERIETKEMFDSLSRLDLRIGLFQGYYFDKGEWL